MNIRLSKVCAFLLVLAISPGFGEIVENAAHLFAEGHLAHVAPEGDRHEPTGPEHGCTPLFHFCGCHASLAFLGAQPLPATDLRLAGNSSQPTPVPRLTGFWPSIDRPPQA